MKLTTKELTIIAVFTAIMVICSQISIPIPFSPVPITLSLFAVFLSTMLLGWKNGTLVQVIYIVLGICGAPVFQGFTGGVSRVFGPTGGYIISYVFMAFVMGFLIDKLKIRGRFKMIAVMTVGLAICYIFGTLWLSFQTGLTITKALYTAVIPFMPLDFVKIGVASLIAYDLKARLLKAHLLPMPSRKEWL